jgi:hypothetical protein
MTLTSFLSTHDTLVGVELLPDNRLINVVLLGDQLYGVVVDDIPSNVSATPLVATLENNIITVGTLTFDTDNYVMLSTQE